MIKIADHHLDAMFAMLSPDNPDLTKQDLNNTLTGELSKAEYSKEPLLTRQQVADRFSVSLATINRWLRDGTLNKVKIGGSVRIPESEIERYLKQAA